MCKKMNVMQKNIMIIHNKKIMLVTFKSEKNNKIKNMTPRKQKTR